MVTEKSTKPFTAIMDKAMWIGILRASFLITLIPISFGLIQAFLFQNDERFILYNTWWQWVLFNAGITFLLTLSASSIGTYVGLKMPYETTKYPVRLIVLLLSVTSAAAAIMFMYHMAWCPYLMLECFSRESLFTNITLAVVITIIITVINEGVCLFEMWKKSLLNESALREENLKTQLEVLKSQINPHFLFNTLNSIYVQSGKNPELARESILHFSELLSYQLYDSREKQVSLEAEMEYLKNYIELEKMRQGDAVDLMTYFEAPSTDVKVAPLLFTPVIENAFKYGLASGLDVYKMSISLKADEQHIVLLCKNEYRPMPKTSKGGLGLENLRKRLELIYPGQHEFSTSTVGNTFTTLLKIDITQ